MVMPAIGINAFLQKSRPKLLEAQKNDTRTTETVFVIKSSRLGLEAEAILQNGEFVVKSGSIARKSWQSDPNHGYAPLFKKLVDNKILADRGEFRVFETDYAFARVQVRQQQ